MLLQIQPPHLVQELESISKSLGLFVPEIYLAGISLLCVLLDFWFQPKDQRLWTLLAVFLLLGYIGLLLDQYVSCACLWNEPLFSGMLRVDHFVLVCKLILALILLLTFLLGAFSKDILENRKSGRLYYYYLFSMLLACNLMLMSANLLVMYLSIEFLSIASYILTYFRMDKRSSEGSLKYLLFGAFSSGLMLYGISLLYGFTGTLEMTEYQLIENIAKVPGIALLLAIVLTLAGILFKISSFPFHFWTPDVYESAPVPVIAFFSTAPKLAALAILFRLFESWHLIPLSISEESFYLKELLSWLAIFTLVVGNFAALLQNNLKRLMAYSSIAQGGILMIPVFLHSEFALEAWYFYFTVYLLLNFGVFLCIELMAARIESKSPGKGYDLEYYSGLGLKESFVGVALLILMIGLTGLPPTAGFTAKLFIFTAIWEEYQSTSHFSTFILLLTALFSTVIALFYYLKIPYYLFFRKEIILFEESDSFTLTEKIALFVLTWPVLILFFRADWLLDLFL